MKICKFDQKRCFQPSASGVTEARWVTPGGTSGSPEQQEEEAKYSKGTSNPNSNVKHQHLGGQNKVTFKQDKSSGSPEQWKEEAK